MKEFYLFPGGGLEESETMKECVKRETLEETGYLIKVDDLIYVNEYINQKNPADRCINVFFLGSLKDKKPVQEPLKDNGKIKKVVWYDLDKITEIDLRPKDIRDRLKEDYVNSFKGKVKYSVDYKK